MTKCLNSSPPLSNDYILVTLLDEVHEEVYSELVLEHILHVHDEGVLHIEQDVFLQFNILKLLIINDNVLSDTLHSIYFVVFVMLNQIYLSESALPNHLPYYKVSELHFFLQSCEYKVTSSLYASPLFLLL